MGSYTIKPITGDGNCLFRSVSYCVYNTENRHREIRMAVVNEVTTNWNNYKEFIIGDLSYSSVIRNANDYAHVMSRNGEYGGEVEIAAMAKIFPSCKFRVHTMGLRRHVSYGSGNIVHNLRFSGPRDAGHYDEIANHLTEIEMNFVKMNKSMQCLCTLGQNIMVDGLKIQMNRAEFSSFQVKENSRRNER